MASIRQPARERLLRAADTLFYANGIAATGVDAVIAQAGVATGSLYKNFSGKDDLVTAYLIDRDHRFRTLWDAHVDAATTPAGRLLAIFDATEEWELQAHLGRGCAHVAATAQLPEGHPGIGAAAAHKRHLNTRLAALAAAADLHDPVRAAGDIALIYDGMLSGLAIGADPAPIERGRRLAELVVAQARPASATD